MTDNSVLFTTQIKFESRMILGRRRVLRRTRRTRRQRKRHSTQPGDDWSTPKGKQRRISPLRTGRRTLSWGRDRRSRGRVRIGGTDRCTSAAAAASAPSWRLPWFSWATHSAAFIQKEDENTRTSVYRTNKVNITVGRDQSADRRRLSYTTVTHDDHTLPFGTSSTGSSQNRREALIALLWSGGGKPGAFEDNVSAETLQG